MGGSGPDESSDDDAPGGAPGEGAPGGAPGDRVAAAAEELYGAAPDAFTGRRAELAAAARATGDRGAAKAIGALRRPTRAAWVVNRLARTDPSAPPKLAELAAALTAAQRAGHGPRLRELSSARSALVDALTRQALAIAGVPDPPPSLRLEVTQTLTAALADPGVAAAFAAGTLTRAAQWSGFGVLPENTPSAGTGADGEHEDRPGPAADTRGEDARAENAQARDTRGKETRARDARAADLPRAVREAGRTAAARPAPEATPGAAPRSGGGIAPKAGARAGPDAAARRQAEAAERLAREAAERTARRRQQYQDAERVAASTSAAAAQAGSAEDWLEAEVRDLEQRLIRARSDLAAARLRARQAESAERRARHALDLLPPY